MLPGRHLALSSLINRLVDRADVATIDPALVRQVRRAELLAAASLLAVADDAVGREHLAPAGDGSGPAFGPGRIGQRLRIVGNGQHRVGIEDAVAAERHHLTDAGVRARRAVDAHRDRVCDRIGGAAPQPIAVDEVGKAGIAGGINPVTGGAVVPEQAVAILPPISHPVRVAADLVIAHRLYPPRPAGTGVHGSAPTFSTDRPIVVFLEYVQVGIAQR